MLQERASAGAGKAAEQLRGRGGKRTACFACVLTAFLSLCTEQELAYNVALGVHHLIDKGGKHPPQISSNFPSRGIPPNDQDYPDFPEARAPALPASGVDYR